MDWVDFRKANNSAIANADAFPSLSRTTQAADSRSFLRQPRQSGITGEDVNPGNRSVPSKSSDNLLFLELDQCLVLVFAHFFGHPFKTGWRIDGTNAMAFGYPSSMGVVTKVLRIATHPFESSAKAVFSSLPSIGTRRACMRLGFP